MPPFIQVTKQKRTITPSPTVISEAQGVYARQLNTQHEDTWWAIGDKWDINLFMEEGQLKATLYPVIDGNTDTSQPFEVKLKD